MSPPNIQNSNFAKTPKMSFFEPKQPIVHTKKLWKPGEEGFWKIWKRRFFQDIQNSFW